MTRALICDFGGVLTSPLQTGFLAYQEESGVSLEELGTAMGKATRKEHTMLAMVAGRCSVGDDTAAPIGAALEERARSGWQRPLAPEAERPSLLDRVRAALVA